MKKIIIISLASVLFYSCSPNQYQASPTDNNNVIDIEQQKLIGNQRFILEYADLESLEKEISNAQGVKVRRMHSNSALVAYISNSAAKNLQAKLANLKIYPDIEMSVGPINEVDGNARPGSGGGTTQPTQSLPWGISKIKAPQAHATTKGAGVKVCVVDTGVDSTHPDLKNNLIGGVNFVVIKGKIDSTKWNDDNGHGSHVAGTIAAEDNSIGVIGVAPLAKIFAVKVLDSRGSGYMSDVTDGITSCVTHGTHIINMSLGGTGDPTADSPLKTAILNAQAAGVEVVVAAGNEGQDSRNTVPAGYPSVIAVAATDINNNFPSWSNFGLDNNDYSAPGVNISSTWKAGAYRTISGTSMASPHLAGVVALKKSVANAALVAVDLGVSSSIQGLGLIDAAASAQSNTP